MDAKQAIAVAKSYITDVFSDDGATNVGLEELRFDESDDTWLVTIGFTRRWDGPQGLDRYTRGHREPWPRTFKTVEIEDSTGRVRDLRHWPVAA